MRIALYHNLPSGGAKRVVYEHTRALVAAGHTVDVYEPETADSGFCDVAPVASQVTRLPFHWDHGAPRTRLAKVSMALRNAVSWSRGYRRLTEMQRQLAVQLDQAGYDLVYVHHDLYETAPSLLRFLRTPSVYFCAEPRRSMFEAPLADRMLPSNQQSGQNQWWRAFLPRPFAHYLIANERLNTLSASMVITNSVYSCESILRAHGGIARCCTLGVDVDLFSPTAQPREAFVLSVGAFRPHKGFHFIIRSLGLMPQNHRPPLVLVGDQGGSELDYLRALARDVGVDLTTHVRITDETLRGLYRQAALFLYAPYLEPLGLTALEAMACGTPVLGVREGGVRETVVDGNSGWLVERNEAQFAAMIEQVRTDPAELVRRGAWAQQYVRDNWTWERSLQDLLRLFDEALIRSKR